MDNEKPGKIPPDVVTAIEIIEMALSDHVSFDQIQDLHGLEPDEVKALMRRNLKPGRYHAWRRRVRRPGDRRSTCDRHCRLAKDRSE